jgi:hypothetical protein
MKNSTRPCSTALVRISSLTLLLVGACASSPDDRSSEAEEPEQLGRIKSREVAGLSAQKSVRGFQPSIKEQALTSQLANGTTSVPIYEYKVAMEDGGSATVRTTQANLAVGACVGVNKSTGSTTVRLHSAVGCKP